MSIRALVLEPDNPSNTTIFSEDDKALYSVVTEFPGNQTLTHVRNHEENILATLEWQNVLPDRVALGSKEQISISDWLKKSPIPFVETVSFKDDSGRKYKWAGMGSGQALQLYADDVGPKDPIARFQKSLWDRTTSPRTLKRPATLLLSERAVEIMDTVVISFLFLEKTRRKRENSVQNKADVLGTPYLSPPGFKAIHNGGV